MKTRFLAAALAVTMVGAATNVASAAEKVRAGILKMAALTDLWVAKEAGIFAKNGLDVELIEFRNGNEAINAHRSGSVDFILSIPGTAMTALVAQTANWAGFSHCFEPIDTDKEAFATWASGYPTRFYYAPYTTDVLAKGAPASYTGFGYWLKQNGVQGTCCFLTPYESAFELSLSASTNYGVSNGRIDHSFKTPNAALTPSVTDAVTAANVIANGLNYVGTYATAAQQWNMLYPGQISGPFLQIGAYVDAIWLNANIQLAEMNMFTGANSIPNDPTGYALIKAACKSLFAMAIKNGVIQQGVTLTSTQAALVNNQAGLPIDKTLQSVGWYFQVNAPLSVQSTPPCLFWYTGAFGVTSLNVASINVQ